MTPLHRGGGTSARNLQYHTRTITPTNKHTSMFSRNKSDSEDGPANGLRQRI